MPDIVVTLSAIITVIVFLLGVFGTTIRLWDKVGFVAIFIAILWGAMLALIVFVVSLAVGVAIYQGITYSITENGDRETPMLLMSLLVFGGIILLIFLMGRARRRNRKQNGENS